MLLQLLLVEGGEGGAFLFGKEGVFGLLALFAYALALFTVVDRWLSCACAGCEAVLECLVARLCTYLFELRPVLASSAPQRAFVLLLFLWSPSML